MDTLSQTTEVTPATITLRKGELVDPKAHQTSIPDKEQPKVETQKRKLSLKGGLSLLAFVTAAAFAIGVGLKTPPFIAATLALAVPAALITAFLHKKP